MRYFQRLISDLILMLLALIHGIAFGFLGGVLFSITLRNPGALFHGSAIPWEFTVTAAFAIFGFLLWAHKELLSLWKRITLKELYTEESTYR